MSLGSMRIRQLLSIIRIEVGKVLFSRRVLIVIGLAAIPIALLVVYNIFFDQLNDGQNLDEAKQVFAFIYSSIILGAVVFFGSAVIFTTLFRGEILERNIHYYLLMPLRRELLVLGKYIAGLMSAFSLFGMTTLICFLLLYMPFGMERLMDDLFNGSAFGQLGNYLGVTLLACTGYGAVFMATGLIFRNPLFPVAFVVFWELLHFVMPPALKAFSVIHYLKGLLPVPLDDGPFAVLMASPSLTVSIAGILSIATAALAVTIWVLKRLQLSYNEE